MQKAKILVVDDEAAITRLVRMNLEQTGAYEVREENCGANAVDAVRAFVPDLLLLDVMMPDADGADIAGALRADPAFDQLPIIFMTAMVSKQEASVAHGTIGGNQFVAKPVSRDALLNAIQQRLSRVPQR